MHGGKHEGYVIMPSEYYSDNMHFYLECRNNGNVRVWYIEGNYDNAGFGVRKALSASNSYDSNCRSTIKGFDFKNKKGVTYKCRSYNKDTNTFGDVYTYTTEVGGTGTGEEMKLDLAANCVILLRKCDLRYSVTQNYDYGFDNAVDYQFVKQDNLYQSCDLKYLVR